MPILENYHAFAGRHWETGSLANALTYAGVNAPHTGQPMSEALLMGIAGGIVFGYFTFDYTGFDPILALLTRNTFDPLTTLLDRLAWPREVRQTTDPELATKNLVNTLENGSPAIVWADTFSLPYNALGREEQYWAMNPIVVYGYEGDTAYIADRSSQPLTVTAAELSQARARVKKDKFRLMVLDSPDMSKLPSAIQKGIWQTISLYTEQPPKGRKENFGSAALQYWARMLTNTRHKQSWTRYFPAGSRLYAGLTSGFRWIHGWQGAAHGAERGLYADFLEEAAAILNNPVLGTVAEQFRACKMAWDELGRALLPESVSLFKETRELLTRNHDLFNEQGDTSRSERIAIKARLKVLRTAVETDFPLSDAEISDLYTHLADLVLKLHDQESDAIQALQAAMAGA
ncbi:MAG: DUF4872 domain-containing protein [Anaerolineaceae bacterium]|nr:DUF4872 domain-containing protein [Anaerolineaceae bacterium]